MPEGAPRVQQGYNGRGPKSPYLGDGSRFGFRLGGVASPVASNGDYCSSELVAGEQLKTVTGCRGCAMRLSVDLRRGGAWADEIPSAWYPDHRKADEAEFSSLVSAI
jgi:hypothetical protein